MHRTLALGIVIALTACATSDEPKVSREETQVSSFKARVAAVDQQTRMVTLVGADGARTSFRADEAVKNLGQVKVGDELQGQLVETLMVEIRAPKPEDKAAAATVEDVVATAQPGQKPSGLWVRQIQATYTIESIDKAKGGGMLRDVNGKSTFVKARDPAVLDRVKVGDTVVVTLLEGLSLDVVTPAP